MRASCLIILLASGLAWASSEPVHLEMPSTGLLPSNVCLEYVSRMGERHGGSKLSWSSYSLTLPFLDPRKSTVGKWAVDAHIDLDATLLSTGGEMDLRRNELYSAILPLSLIRTWNNTDNRLILSVAPAAASDFAGTARFFDLTAAAMYTQKKSESFTYTVGFAIAPRLVNYGVLPTFGFKWQATPDWEIGLSRYKLTALYRSSERLQVGPYLAVRGGAWMVDTPEGDRIFRVNSLVAGVTAEYDFHSEGERKRIIHASVGSTIATSAGYYRRNFSKDSMDIRHYKPALYISTGVDFRF